MVVVLVKCRCSTTTARGHGSPCPCTQMPTFSPTQHPHDAHILPRPTLEEPYRITNPASRSVVSPADVMLHNVSPEMLAAAGLNAELLAKLSTTSTGATQTVPFDASKAGLAPIPTVVAPMPNPSPQLVGFMDWLQQYANPNAMPSGPSAAPLAAIPPPPLPTFSASLLPSASLDATHTRSDSKETEPEGMKELVHKVWGTWWYRGCTPYRYAHSTYKPPRYNDACIKTVNQHANAASAKRHTCKSWKRNCTSFVGSKRKPSSRG